MTASAWIVNARRDRALMAWHNIYRAWSWLGGHADGETVSITVYRIPNLTAIRADEPIPEGEYLTFDVEVKAID